jgi:hypothetical protein
MHIMLSITFFPNMLIVVITSAIVVSVAAPKLLMSIKDVSTLVQKIGCVGLLHY